MKLALVFLPLLIGLIIGFYSHDSINSKLKAVNVSKKVQTESFDPTNNLRVDLNGALRENVILLTSTLRRIYNKEPFAPDSIEALNENIDDIGDIIKAYYGPDSKADFLLLWKSQDQSYVNYIEGVRDNDKKQKDQAEQGLNDYVENSLTYWKKLNPNFDSEKYKMMLDERINFIKNFADDLSGSNISGSYKEQHSAYQQNGKIADFLTLMVVKQFPDKFK